MVDVVSKNHQSLTCLETEYTPKHKDMQKKPNTNSTKQRDGRDTKHGNPENSSLPPTLILWLHPMKNMLKTKDMQIETT